VIAPDNSTDRFLIETTLSKLLILNATVFYKKKGREKVFLDCVDIVYAFNMVYMYVSSS